MNIEPLELRIAPATLAGQILTYTDIDGDKVAITISKGALAPGMFTFDTGSVDGDNSVSQQLRIINVSGAAGIDGANITMKVTKTAGGDGRAAVGRINAGLHDLGSVTIKGDLGGIACGDSDAATGPALKLLSVGSMGLYGTATLAPGGDLISLIGGAVGAIKVSGDIVDASIGVRNFIDPPDGKIGSIVIGGSLVGGDALAGTVFSTGDIGPVTIKRHLVGGFGEESGKIDSGGNLGPVSIGGNIIGGAGGESGRLKSAGTMGAVKIGGSLTGGAGSFSGRISSTGAMGDTRIGGDVTGSAGFGSGSLFSNTAIGNVSVGGDLSGGERGDSGQIFSFGGMGDARIGGSIIGGAGDDSGQVSANAVIRSINIRGDIIGSSGNRAGLSGFGGIGNVRIGGDLVGGGPASGLISFNGGIGHVRIGGDVIGVSAGGSDIRGEGGIISSSSGRIDSVTIGGSIIAGSDASSGSVFLSGAIVAGDDIGPIKIAGSIIGNSTNPVLIIAQGQAVQPTEGFDVAIASLTVRGDVRFARILAGFDRAQDSVNADAAIGAVTVGRDWVASSLVAGATNLGADDAAGGTGPNTDNVNFGDSHDVLQGSGSPALIARIASITIKGNVIGSLAIGDHFGFVAQQIDKLKIGSRAFTLAAGPSSPADNFLLPFTDDARLLEV